MINFKMGFKSLLIASALTTTAFAVVENRSLDNERLVRIYGDITLDSVVNFDYGKPHIVIKTVYPQLVSATADPNITDFNDTVLDMVDDTVDGYKSNVASEAQMQAQLPKNSVKNNLNLDYSTSYVKIKNHHLLSVRFSVQSVIAGYAHPIRTFKVINYDVDEGNVLTLDDIFKSDSNYLVTLSEFAQKNLKHRGVPVIADSLTPTAEHYKNWNIKPRGIYISFEPGAIAPTVNGSQHVLVPYSVLKDVIKPDAPLYACVKQPRLCRMNNLFTGGFIDEAENGGPVRTFNPVMYLA